MSRAWKVGSTRAWRRIRAAVLDRDGHRCQLQQVIYQQTGGIGRSRDWSPLL